MSNDEIVKLSQTIAMLSSMVRCGDEHSVESAVMVEDSQEIIRKALADQPIPQSVDEIAKEIANTLSERYMTPFEYEYKSTFKEEATKLITEALSHQYSEEEMLEFSGLCGFDNPNLRREKLDKYNKQRSRT